MIFTFMHIHFSVASGLNGVYLINDVEILACGLRSVVLSLFRPLELEEV